METYRGFIISKTDPVPPIPGWEEFKFSYVHKDYDGEGDPRHGHAQTVMACKQEIDDLLDEVLP